MSMPKDEIQQDYVNSWRNYLNSLDLAIQEAGNRRQGGFRIGRCVHR